MTSPKWRYNWYS